MKKYTEMEEDFVCEPAKDSNQHQVLGHHTKVHQDEDAAAIQGNFEPDGVLSDVSGGQVAVKTPAMAFLPAGGSSKPAIRSESTKYSLGNVGPNNRPSLFKITRDPNLQRLIASQKNRKKLIGANSTVPAQLDTRTDSVDSVSGSRFVWMPNNMSIPASSPGTSNPIIDLTTNTTAEASGVIGESHNALLHPDIGSRLKETVIPRRFYTATQTDWLLNNGSSSTSITEPGGWGRIAEEFNAEFGAKRAKSALKMKYYRLSAFEGEGVLADEEEGEDADMSSDESDNGELGEGETYEHDEQPSKSGAHEQSAKGETHDCIDHLATDCFQKMSPTKEKENEPAQQEDNQAQKPPLEQQQHQEKNTEHARMKLAQVWLEENIHKFWDVHYKTDWQLLADLINDIFELEISASWVMLCWDECLQGRYSRGW